MHYSTLPSFLTEHHPIWSLEERREILSRLLSVFQSRDGLNRPGFRVGIRASIPRETTTSLPPYTIFSTPATSGAISAPWRRKDFRWLAGFSASIFSCAKPGEDLNRQQFKASMINTYTLASGDLTMVKNGTLKRAADRAVCQLNNLGVGILYGRPGASGYTPVTLLAMAAVSYQDPTYYLPISFLEDSKPRGKTIPLRWPSLPFHHGDEFLRAFALPKQLFLKRPSRERFLPFRSSLAPSCNGHTARRL